MDSQEKYARLATVGPALRRQAEKVAAIEDESRTLELVKTMTTEQIQQMLHELHVHQIELEIQNEELRKTQVELDIERGRYFNLYHLAPIGYCTLNEDGVIIETNLTASKLLGVTNNKLIMQPLSRYISNKDQDTLYLFRKQLIETGKPQTCELRMVKSDGTQFWVQIEAIAIKDECSVPIHRIVLSDITSRKNAEEQLKTVNEELAARVEEEVARRMQAEEEQQKERAALIQSEKMAQLGNMLGAIIHQWKQPLDMIGLEAQGIKESYKLEELDSASIERTVNSIMDKVMFMSATADDFKDFYKPSKERKAISIIEQISSVVKLLGKQLSLSNIDLSVEGDKSICTKGCTNELKQVVLNIISNAKEMFEKMETKNAMLRISVVEEDGKAVLSISDNAGGIPNDLLPDKLFEPFISTKGNGIGLSLSRTIIEENMKGKLRVNNTDDGACFTIELPLA